jgi:hypothetical protein
MSGIGTVRSEDVPFDRLTRLANIAVETLDGEISLELEIESGLSDVKGMVLLSDDDGYGVALFGYQSHAEAMTDLMIQMKALFAADGKNITVVTPDGKVVL